MSRAIKNATTKLSLEEYKNGNKLIFAKVHDRQGAFLLNDNRLIFANFQTTEQEQLGSIYIGKVKNVVENLNAAFVEIASKEICYLPLKDAKNPFIINRAYDGRILQGDEILVQVTRAPLKTKQASVTCDIQIYNEHFVLSLQKGIQFSKKIEAAKQNELKEMLQEKYGKNCEVTGVLFRTKAASISEIELFASFEGLYDEWMIMLQTAKHRTCFTCIRKQTSYALDCLETFIPAEEYEEIITDDKEIYEEISSWAKIHNKNLRLYQDTKFPLTGLYALTTKVEEALKKRVWLKSGAYLVIEHTEALTTIDVNTGKYEKKKDMTEAHHNVNMEAAEEIALQLRLRNISGIIIVDFINCQDAEQKNSLMKYLKTLVKQDRIPTKVIDMTPLGLVEITRKKELKPLYEQVQVHMNGNKNDSDYVLV